MNWEQLRESIYFLDGSFRDIRIFGTTENDWRLWTEFVNENYPIIFPDYELNVKETHIDIDKVIKAWHDFEEDRYTVSVYVGNIVVNAHFFDEDDIENDITPTEVNSIEDHLKLIDYMIKVSNLLNKKVILTPENTPDVELISVCNNKVDINLTY